MSKGRIIVQNKVMIYLKFIDQGEGDNRQINRRMLLCAKNSPLEVSCPNRRSSWKSMRQIGDASRKRLDEKWTSLSQVYEL